MYRNVGQVDVHIIQLCNARIIFDRAESTKPQAKLVGLQWAKWCDQDVQSQIELFPANKQRVVYVAVNIHVLYLQNYLADFSKENVLDL